VDLLVDRSKQERRNILQIVLNESLNTAPKLTQDQLAALALVFLFKYTQNLGAGSHALFGQYLDKHAQPFIATAATSQASYQHMEFTGCGAVGMLTTSLEAVLGQVYQGLFQKGFDVSELASQKITIGSDQRFFNQCFNDPTKLQVRVNNKEFLNRHFDACAIAEGDRTEILKLFDSTKMSDAEIRIKCVEIRPYMADLFDRWTKSPMKVFTLTSVGMAIGHANVKRLVGEFADLSIWIN